MNHANSERERRKGDEDGGSSYEDERTKMSMKNDRNDENEYGRKGSIKFYLFISNYYIVYLSILIF